MSNNRIEIDQKNNLVIRINAFYDKGKQNMLALWLILWSMAGIGMLVQFFLPHDEKMDTYLLVWCAFWAYFEYKAIFAYRWRKWGKELMTFEGDTLTVVRKIGERGIPRKYDIGSIRHLEYLNEPDNSFVKMLSNAYWNVGKEGLVFVYKGKDIFFGRELDAKEAKNVQKHFNTYLDRFNG